MTPGIAETLAHGGLVVTANNRLARNLRAEFDREQLAAGRQVWRSATVLPWTAWLHQLWWQSQVNSGTDDPVRLLTEFQARLAWQAVIDQELALRNAWIDAGGRAVARLAAGSWSTARAWQMDTATLLASADSSDSETFARWAVAYEALCRTEGWIDEASIPRALAAAPPRQSRGRHLAVRLTGFEAFTPAQQTLVDALTGAGMTVHVDPLPRFADATIRQVRCEDPVEEIALAARWARAARTRDRAARVAVVVPDLGPRRELVRRIFRDVFVPGWSLGNLNGPPVNISLGSALAEVGLIHAGLLLLRMLCAELDYRDVGQLLRSPFVAGAAAERERRAQFDLAYRERLGLTNPVTRILDEFDSAELLMGTRLRAALAAAGSDSPRLPSAWVRVISQFLADAGWPGDAPLSSEQHQAMRAWHELLDEFAASDAVTASIQRTQAVACLSQLADEQIFQPEARVDGVQVLGVMEALGQSFDHLWICGLTADKWPPPARPDALLPLQLMRELGLPDSAPERSRERAAGLLDALSHSAPVVYLSWAHRDGDKAFDASPLIQVHAEVRSEDVAAFGGLPRNLQLFLARPVAVTRTDVAPPVGPSERVPGGTRLMQLQSNCPARAFLEMRLGAFELATPAAGCDARLRGVIIHDTLRRIFAGIHSSRDLANLAADELAKIVHDSVERAVAAAIPPHGAVVRAIGRIEVGLCNAMMREFLRIELTRPPFTIRAMERDREAALGELLLRLRPDRVDETDSGTRMVIDFKTGDIKKSAWLGDRPEEPQLPIYALALDARAAAFVQLRRSGITWVGISADDLGIEGITQPPLKDKVQRYEDWTVLQTAWQRRLLGIARELLDGDARIHRFRRSYAEGQWALLTRIYDYAADDETESEVAE